MARRLGGGTRTIEANSFHATPIGIMLNAEKFAGDRSPRPPGPAAHTRHPPNVSPSIHRVSVPPGSHAPSVHLTPSAGGALRSDGRNGNYEFAEPPQFWRFLGWPRSGCERCREVNRSPRSSCPAGPAGGRLVSEESRSTRQEHSIAMLGSRQKDDDKLPIMDPFFSVSTGVVQ